MRTPVADLPLAIAGHWSWSGSSTLVTNTNYLFSAVPGGPFAVTVTEEIGEGIRIMPNGQIVTEVAGIWLVTGLASYGSGANAGARQINIKRNAAAAVAAQYPIGASTSNGATVQVSGFTRAEVGDSFEVGVYQNSNASLGLAAVEFWMAFLGRAK